MSFTWEVISSLSVDQLQFVTLSYRLVNAKSSKHDMAPVQLSVDFQSPSLKFCFSSYNSQRVQISLPCVGRDVNVNVIRHVQGLYERAD